MQLSEVVSVPGLPGLYTVGAKRGDGVIITSLADGKSQFLPVRQAAAASLDSIIIYTSGDGATLKEVLASIKKNEKSHPVPDVKDEEGLKKWLGTVLPDYDKEKVHLSDMKKLAKWYNLLNEKNLIEELTAETKEEGEELTAEQKEAASKKENKPKVQAQTSVKAHTKPAPARKVTTPRKAS